MTVLAPPKRRSYSQLSTYLECPELYFYKYIERVPEHPAVWTVGGTSFHTLAERYLLGELGPEPTVEAIEDAWALAWTDALVEVYDRNPDAPTDLTTWRAANRGKETAEWWMRQGPEWVRQFIGWWRVGGGARLQVLDLDGPALERRFEVEMDGVTILAIPDALVVDEHGQVDVLDYKSSKDQRGPGGSLQLGVYKAGLTAATGLEATWGMYYMTRTAAIVMRDLTAWSPDVIGPMFSDFDRRERAGEYPPKPGDACRFCPFKKDRCTAYN